MVRPIRTERYASFALSVESAYRSRQYSARTAVASVTHGGRNQPPIYKRQHQYMRIYASCDSQWKVMKLIVNPERIILFSPKY